MCISISIRNLSEHQEDEQSCIIYLCFTCDGVCVRVLACQRQAVVGLLPLLPAPQAVVAPRAPCAPQGAARVSESTGRVPPFLVLLVVKNNVAERQETFGRPTSFRRRRRRRLERHFLDYDHLSQKYL